MTAPEDRTYCDDPMCDGDHPVPGQTCTPERCPECKRRPDEEPDPGEADCWACEPDSPPEVPC